MKLPSKRQYPRKLLINDQEYTVKFVRKIPKDKETVGWCDPSEHEICIKTGQSVSETFATFVHETLHAIEFEYGLKIEHALVYKLEKAICDFLLVNF